MEEKEKKFGRQTTPEELAEAIMALRGKPLNTPTPMFRDYIPPPPDRFRGCEEDE